MKVTKQARRDAKQLFRCCVVQGVLNEDRARQAVRKLAELKPRGFEGIMAHFRRLVQMDLDRRTATVESFAALPEQVRAGVVETLNRLHGQGLMITFRENPALLGGLRVKVGCDVYDGSVQSRLMALQESF